MSTKHPCETVEANADVMSLAEMILSDCGCSTSISDRLQRRVAGRIQLHVDGLLGGQKTEPVEQGLYTILYRDNWDGGGDTSYLLARLEPNGEWYAEESGAQLMTYEGDAILRAWPITEDTAMRPDPKPVLNCWCCSTLVTFKQRADADGNCPHCGAELDVDKDLVAQQQAEPAAYLKTAAGVMQLSFEGNPVVNVGADVEVQADTVQPLYAQPPAVAVPDGVARAVEAVAAAIYFADSSDYLSTLWDTLRFLSPEIAAIAESDTRAAWERAEQDRAMLAAAPQGATLSAALADIAAERRRQIEAEGWTPEHDDAYQEGHLADAAACYALHAHDTGASKGSIPAWWPWRNEWWKPTTARRNLVKAGALIAAEIERLDRAAQKGGEA